MGLAEPEYISGMATMPVGELTSASTPMPGLRARFWIEANRRGLLGFRAVAGKLGRLKLKPAHLETGERGEFEAAFYLERQGYTLVERRWRSPDLRGDLDLIGWDGDTLCMIEVKTRTARDLTPARSAVDASKQRMQRRMARAYRRTLPRATRDDILLRFDVVSVYLLPGQKPEFELLRAAFPLFETISPARGVY